MKANMDPVPNDYLARILTAQVYDVAVESPSNWPLCCRAA
jgi:hypothetical protein